MTSLGFAGQRLDAVLAQHARIFLDQDRVGTLGNRRAGEYPHALSGADRAGKTVAGGGDADDPELRGNARDIGRAHRVAVHGRRGEGRLRAQRLHRHRQNTAGRFIQPDVLRAQRLRALQEALQGFLDR